MLGNAQYGAVFLMPLMLCMVHPSACPGCREAFEELAASTLGRLKAPLQRVSLLACIHAYTCAHAGFDSCMG